MTDMEAYVGQMLVARKYINALQSSPPTWRPSLPPEAQAVTYTSAGRRMECGGRTGGLEKAIQRLGRGDIIRDLSLRRSTSARIDTAEGTVAGMPEDYCCSEARIWEAVFFLAQF